MSDFEILTSVLINEWGWAPDEARFELFIYRIGLHSSGFGQIHALCEKTGRLRPGYVTQLRRLHDENATKLAAVQSEAAELLAKQAEIEDQIQVLLARAVREQR